MKHLKTFEEIKIYKGKGDEEFNFKVGDTIYCLDDHQTANWENVKYLTIGEKYTIDSIYKAINTTYLKLKEVTFPQGNGGFHYSRFTKNPYHPEIIKDTTNKYNL